MSKLSDVYNNLNWRLIKRKGPHSNGVYVDDEDKLVKIFAGNGRHVKAERVFKGTLKGLEIFKDYDITPRYIFSEIIDDRKEDRFNGYIIMTYVGKPLKKSNAPPDAIDQINRIEDIVENTTGEFLTTSGKYFHNDIDMRNFMVLNNRIRLIDLGLTSFGKGLGLRKNGFSAIKRSVKKFNE